MDIFRKISKITSKFRSSNKKKEYAAVLGLFLIFIAMMPQVCAQTAQANAENAAKIREILIQQGREYLGCPYRSGATGPATFDCSGFVMTVFKEGAKIQLPRKASSIYEKSEKIKREELESGDLVFFSVNGKINHVGIYEGDGMFIHSASDGSKTGVIESSLNERYWKNHYTASGRYVASAALAESAKKTQNVASVETETPKNDVEPQQNNILPQQSNTEPPKSENDSTQAKANESENEKPSKNSLLSSIILDATVAFGWNVFDSTAAKLCFRGLSTEITARYSKSELQPGLGLGFFWDKGTKTFQIPLTFSVTLNEFVRIFAGPVFSFGDAELPGSDTKIEKSIFPGTIGVAFCTPSIKAGKTKVALSQEIRYSTFNNTNGAALGILDSAASGIVFSTGIKVTLPLQAGV